MSNTCSPLEYQLTSARSAVGVGLWLVYVPTGLFRHVVGSFSGAAIVLAARGWAGFEMSTTRAGPYGQAGGYRSSVTTSRSRPGTCTALCTLPPDGAGSREATGVSSVSCGLAWPLVNCDASPISRPPVHIDRKARCPSALSEMEWSSPTGDAQVPASRGAPAFVTSSTCRSPPPPLNIETNSSVRAPPGSRHRENSCGGRVPKS